MGFSAPKSRELCSEILEIFKNWTVDGVNFDRDIERITKILKAPSKAFGKYSIEKLSV